MNLKITPEWLRKHAAADEGAEFTTGLLNPEAFDADVEALRPVSSPDTQQHRTQEFTPAFGKLVQLWRIDKGYSLDALAKAADLDEEELESIEQDVQYVPEPRTVCQLADVLKLPLTRLMQLAGLASSSDSAFSQQALRFATRAQSLDRLNVEQKQALHEFVRYLAEEK